MKGLNRTDLLQIDGQPMPTPTDSPSIEFADIESDDSGADEMGVYHREVLRFGVLNCTLTYGYLNNADCAYLLGLLQNKTTFQFTCPVASSADNVTQTVTRTCSASRRASGGIWNCRFKSAEGVPACTKTSLCWTMAPRSAPAQSGRTPSCR